MQFLREERKKTQIAFNELMEYKKVTGKALQKDKSLAEATNLRISKLEEKNKLLLTANLEVGKPIFFTNEQLLLLLPEEYQLKPRTLKSINNAIINFKKANGNKDPKIKVTLPVCLFSRHLSCRELMTVVVWARLNNHDFEVVLYPETDEQYKTWKKNNSSLVEFFNKIEQSDKFILAEEWQNREKWKLLKGKVQALLAENPEETAELIKADEIEYKTRMEKKQKAPSSEANNQTNQEGEKIISCVNQTPTSAEIEQHIRDEAVDYAASCPLQGEEYDLTLEFYKFKMLKTITNLIHPNLEKLGCIKCGMAHIQFAVQSLLEEDQQQQSATLPLPTIAQPQQENKTVNKLEVDVQTLLRELVREQHNLYMETLAHHFLMLKQNEPTRDQLKKEIKEELKVEIEQQIRQQVEEKLPSPAKSTDTSPGGSSPELPSPPLHISPTVSRMDNSPIETANPITTTGILIKKFLPVESSPLTENLKGYQKNKDLLTQPSTELSILEKEQKDIKPFDSPTHPARRRISSFMFPAPGQPVEPIGLEPPSRKRGESSPPVLSRNTSPSRLPNPDSPSYSRPPSPPG
ncbi:MAG TPA: hypothetical protein VHZ76_08100 [Gammaproteobacteria bacterium]|nr:hypothetical protein [Gammaproteobacteria bacterium]